MDNNSKNNINDNSIDEKLKTAFGYSDEQLLAEFEAAEAQWKASPELQEELKAPEGELEKILAMAHERRQEQEGKKKRHFRLRNAWKPLLVAALLGALVMSSGIGGSAKRSYEYKKRESDISSKVVWNNSENLVKYGKSKEAYQYIEENLGINVICFNELPEGLTYKYLTSGQNYAVLTYENDDKRVSLTEVRYSIDNSGATYADTDSYTTIYNKFLELDIPIRKNILQDGQIEYTSDFELENAYYSISGNVSEESFITIVKSLYFK
ncbi:hypothetical protein C0033_16675 [Clostridium sp. chh4-2]|uniref:DUF4367 domain-containing protein n=1 Tax=Clostridium sp. chh4-2 TaxID=2067550 RepID=UPI000CCDE285|nr:DUF4367 domain-containing protein [Clostridium sp. chh4-2]PNV60827.1 hypothetical protein C0033_16675 [Clostridium sp. chh4-2]